MKQKFSTGAIWEDKIGYSRAVKCGNVIEISGTTSVKDGAVFMPNDYFEQTMRIYEIINETLTRMGANMNDVMRCRIFVTDISRWEDVGRAHHHFFKEVKPALSMLGGIQLIDPSLVVEIEVSAIINE